MNLIACYSVFDGCELLEPSIKSIQNHVDWVVICWQAISNNGNKISIQDYDYLVEIGGKYHNVSFVSFLPNLNASAKENERKKHNLMIDRARKLGATHFMMAATDHFYIASQFERIKNLVESSNLDASFTQMYTYFKHPTWQITPIEKYSMPFICKLYPHTVIEKVRNFPVHVDPSVQMNTCQKWVAFGTEIMLHHYSLVRQDIRGKFENAASPWRKHQIDEFIKDWDGYDLKENPGIKYFQGRKVKVVPDYFNLKHIFERA